VSLISVIFALVIVGVLLWLINTYIPIDEKIKQILNKADATYSDPPRRGTAANSYRERITAG